MPRVRIPARIAYAKRGGRGTDDMRRVPGLRIELSTPASSGRRSTNELTRHSAHHAAAHTDTTDFLEFLQVLFQTHVVVEKAVLLVKLDSPPIPKRRGHPCAFGFFLLCPTKKFLCQLSSNTFASPLRKHEHIFQFREFHGAPRKRQYCANQIANGRLSGNSDKRASFWLRNSILEVLMIVSCWKIRADRFVKFFVFLHAQLMIQIQNRWKIFQRCVSNDWHCFGAVFLN